MKIILVINSIIYILTFIFFYRKDKMCVSTLLWLYYAFFSIFGAILVYDGLYFHVMDGLVIEQNRIEHVSCVPYILLYFTFYMFVTPFRNFKLSKIDIIHIGIKKTSFLKFCNLCCYFEIIYVVVKVIQVGIVGTIGFGNFHDMTVNDGGGDAILYSGPLGPVMHLFNNIGRFINLVFIPYVLVYLTYNYVKGILPKSTFLKCFIPYSVSLLLKGVVGGSRGDLFFSLLEVLFYYLLFKNYIGISIRRKIRVLALVGISLLLVVMVMITNERFGESNITIWAFILRYLGEMWPNLGYEYWDRVNEHPYGDFLFSTFGNNEEDIRIYWFYTTGIHTWWTFTILGRLYFEYGKLLAILIILCIGFYIRKVLNKKRYYLSDVGMIAFLYNLCVSSLFNFVIIRPVDIFGLVMMYSFSLLLRPKKNNL